MLYACQYRWYRYKWYFKYRVIICDKSFNNTYMYVCVLSWDLVIYSSFRPGNLVCFLTFSCPPSLHTQNIECQGACLDPRTPARYSKLQKSQDQWSHRLTDEGFDLVRSIFLRFHFTASGTLVQNRSCSCFQYLLTLLTKDTKAENA